MDGKQSSSSFAFIIIKEIQSLIDLIDYLDDSIFLIMTGDQKLVPSRLLPLITFIINKMPSLKSHAESMENIDILNNKSRTAELFFAKFG